ncbi:uncharacterized protein LY89DRAFT_780542 [Mollisia scopiformis]|uniref:Zn(2)-C6 fungal-type domain-containing protein n=1 Tax=Mollisia scopiformis TaxID=149040 RepID=A0A194XFC6_MOLSC|nr:uncharacterized protein LY89DRAFT_780542 [Mollisia scopiformis]KUJ18472.1 hypothetical protein LY89DRAFT_780542 [Mollisia scopiformis]
MPTPVSQGDSQVIMSDIGASVPDSGANAASTAAPRKRRRPALSCEQCRKRKIKCDRNYPCTQCLQSKTAHCSYSPDSAGAIQHLKKGPSIYQDPIQINAGIPNRSRNAPSTSSSSHLPSDSTSPQVPLSDGTQTSWHSPGSEHLHDKDSAKSHERALLDRIQKLEQKLATANSLNPSKQEHELEDEQSLEDGKSSLDGQDVSVSFFHTLKGNSFFGSRNELHGTYEQKGRLRGTVSKTRFFGQSHWMYSFGTFDRISCMKVNPKNNTPEFAETMKTTDLNELLQRCKSMARAAKAGPHNKFLMNPNYRDAVPLRPVCDKLMMLYFRTHESTLRILHIPTFWKEYQQYWENPAAASSTFIIKMLLAMSIGCCFYQDDDQDWHAQSLQWIFAGQTWLASPFEKGRMHISGLQIHCLVINARLANAVAGDLVWISIGSLLRTAFQMGFHRDPKYLPRMLPLHAELRRRLWATVLELNIQGALDSGMPTLLHLEDFDTEAPANLDDSDLDETMTVLPEAKPRDVYTQTSLQIMLLESFPTRIKVVSHSNNFHSDPSYEEVLALGSTLTKALREHNTFINSVNAASLYSSANPQTQSPIPYVPRMFRNILDLCIRRFLLALHRPFAARAQTDLRYYFSRKVCLDCAMTMLQYPTSDPGDPSIEPGKQDDFTRLKTVSGGFQKGLLVHAAMVIFSELLSQIEEESTFTEQSRAAREPLKQALRGIVDLSALRIMHAENNIKGHLFISVVLAQVEAMELGVPADNLVIAAARKSAEICMALLSKRIPITATDDEYARHVENGSAADGVGLQGASAPQDIGFDTMMQDWTMDSQYFNLPDSWLLSGWEDNQPWGLQV